MTKLKICESYGANGAVRWLLVQGALFSARVRAANVESSNSKAQPERVPRYGVVAGALGVDVLFLLRHRGV